ncbi:hypothetical protein Leryth_015785 [Lithospermum erythrorhizon]|nr:hypothetical protein Leryth_015785 [Lithospermum erythrorhizon]
MIPIKRLAPCILKTLHLNPTTFSTTVLRRLSTKSSDNEWNEAWESAWLPDDLTGKTRAPWETDVNFSLTTTSPDMDSDTKAFIEDMSENWEHRKGKAKTVTKTQDVDDDGKNADTSSTSLYKLENMKKDYRLKKQRIHAGLWVKEIEKMEEAKLGDSSLDGDNIEKLLDSCSEIFDPSSDALNNSEIPSSELKNKPDGWETMSKAGDGNIWEMSQREEDILLQEFERRIAFNKFQIASFIKTHIFSRRRPIDGWKYMIEEIGPNARRGKGSVSRLPTVADEATQPFREERKPISSNLPSHRGR